MAEQRHLPLCQQAAVVQWWCWCVPWLTACHLMMMMSVLMLQWQQALKHNLGLPRSLIVSC